MLLNSNGVFNVAIICTRNRPKELNRLLQNLNDQIILFNEVIIVDSSDDQNKIDKDIFKYPIKFIQSKAGLTLQRNIGIKNLPKTFDYCHFFDDDVVLDHSYLLNFFNYIRENRSISAATGRQILNNNFSMLDIIARTFKLHGRLLKNGINIQPDYRNKLNILNLEWMPGCNMIFSRNLLCQEDIVFDEINRSGYSMGEDVDISLKVRMSTQIHYLPLCLYEHKLSSTNRIHSELMYFNFFHHRLLLTRTFSHLFTKDNLFRSLKIEYLINFLLVTFFKQKKSRDWIDAYKRFKKLTCNL